MFGKYRKTDFEAGDLLIEDTPLARGEEHEALAMSDKFRAPRKVDNRDLCLSSSNQLTTPHCAGYTMAGYVEVQNWKKLHYPSQVNGDKIYLAAKKIDKFSGDGTYLWAAIKGAKSLGFIKGAPKRVKKTRRDVMFALHEHTVCLSGFNITDDWNFINKRTGVIRDSGNKAKSMGGHAVLLCGYDSKGVYIQNSWGADWGIYGFAILSWDQFDRQIHSAMVVAKSKCDKCGN